MLTKQLKTFKSFWAPLEYYEAHNLLGWYITNRLNFNKKV